MKRIIPFLLAVMMLLSVPLAQASAQASISDEVKRILTDPNYNKSAGLPNLLKEAQGEKKAEKTLKELGPKRTTSSPSSSIIWPIYPYWPDYPWDNKPSGQAFANIGQGINWANSFHASYGYYPSFNYYSGNLYRKAEYSTYNHYYEIYEWNPLGSGSGWTYIGYQVP